MAWTEDDAAWMRHAIMLAEQGNATAGANVNRLLKALLHCNIACRTFYGSRNALRSEPLTKFGEFSARSIGLLVSVHLCSMPTRLPHILAVSGSTVGLIHGYHWPICTMMLSISAVT
jgi:hypothetical protein